MNLAIGDDLRGENSELLEDVSDGAAEDASTLKGRIFDCIRKRGQQGATDDEVQVALNMRAQTESPRRRELCMRGRVVNSGRRRKTRAGRSATVWVAVDGPGKGNMPVVKTAAQRLQEAELRIAELEEENKKLRRLDDLLRLRGFRG